MCTIVTPVLGMERVSLKTRKFVQFTPLGSVGDRIITVTMIIDRGFPRWLSSKDPPAIQETQGMRVQSLGWEDPLEEEIATHFHSCLRNSTVRGAWRAIVHESCRVRHDLATEQQ